MPRHHLAFRNFKEETIAATEALFEAKPWRCAELTEAIAIGQEWVDKLTVIYEVPRAEICEVSPYSNDLWLGYNPVDPDDLDRDDAVLGIPGWSIFTLFCLFRTHLLANGVEMVGEDDPKWAASLFYIVKPVMFRARVREDRITTMSARDTYRRDSWDLLTQAGLTFGDRLTGTPEEWKAALRGELPNALEDEDTEMADDLPDEEEFDGDPVTENTDLGITIDLDALNRDAIRALCVANGIPRQGRNREALIVALREAGVTA